MNIHEMNLDVTKKMTVAQVLHLGQGDANGTTLHANIYDDGVPLSLTGKSARLCLRLPDGKSYYAVEGTVSGSVATFDIDETYAASVAGQTDVAYVEVIEGTTVICSTNRFHVVVLESAEEGADPSTSYSSGIIEATNRANAAAEAAEGVVLQAVPTMSANIKGGAKLGAGLAVTDDTLSLDASSIVMEYEKGSAYGVAELDENGIVISSQLPSYVDDVLEYPNVSSFPSTGESGKIYVDTSTNLTYRWTGTGYAEISPSLALGETSSTAYRGDRGAAAYAHGVTNKGTALSSNLYKITTNSEGHVTAGTAVTGADIAGKINGQAITPASVTASGAIQGSSISDGTGTLAQLRESVSRKVIIARITETYSIAANATANAQSISLANIIPDGYTPACITSFTTGEPNVVFSQIGPSFSSPTLWYSLKNTSGNAYTNKTITIDIAFYPADTIERV